VARGGQQIGITHFSAGLAFCRLVSAALAAGLRVTQMVNGDKGMHAALDKKYLARKAKWD
jgi:hypothetical protein